MDFYKKLKANKSPSNESITELLGEVERKLEDMQPVIHDPAVEKSKVQKTISDIKTYLDSLKNVGGTVTLEQQEKIREITRKYNEISVKHSYISDVSASVPKSPRSFRKKTPEISNKEVAQVPQNKVALQEVEEKLKVMRQRRLDRLSVFVAEQSKLSEERSIRNNDSNEIENAIKSIQKTDVDNKISFKSITEENLQNKVIKEETVSNVKSSPKLSRTRSNEATDKFKSNKSSTLKFINKFNCTVPVGSSNEDLTSETNEKTISASIKPDKNTYFDSTNSEVWSHNTQNNPNNLPDLNPILSPNGKQRKAVYLYDHECQFLEGEKRSSLPPLSTFGKEVQQDIVKTDTKSKIHTYENANIKSESKYSPKQVRETQIEKGNSSKNSISVRKKIMHVYENSHIAERRCLTKSQESKIGEGNTSEKVSSVKILEKENKIDHNYSKNEDKAKFSEIKALPKLATRSDIHSHRRLNGRDNTMPTPRSPLKSPLPVPRRNNHAERVLKKVQRNWESLNEILENDSDVDCDEVDDLKKTWEEANVLLSEYKTKINKLDRKSKENANMERLNDIKCQLNDVEEDIRKFKGLKRDSSYMQLSNRLSNYFLEISKMNFSVNDGITMKKTLLDDINGYIKMLENKVIKNEALLLEILDMQVRSIGTNCLSITKV